MQRSAFFKDWSLPEYYQFWCGLKRGIADFNAGRMVSLKEVMRELGR